MPWLLALAGALALAVVACACAAVVHDTKARERRVISDVAAWGCHPSGRC
jgi:hypothetical protein